MAPTGSAGTGQVIALERGLPTIRTPLSDLNTFDADYGYPTMSTWLVRPTVHDLPAVRASTKPIRRERPPRTADWILEESLDIEWAHAEAPASRIVLVEAKTPSSNANLYNNGHVGERQRRHRGVDELVQPPRPTTRQVTSSPSDATSTSTGAYHPLHHRGRR